MNITEEISKHASPSVVYHTLYAYYFRGISVPDLANLYAKSRQTIYNWIQKYEETGEYSRSGQQRAYRRFDEEKRQWILALYECNPLLYLDEARSRFFETFHITISASSVCGILKEGGLTWKKIERRAIQISLEDVLRFSKELDSFPWSLESLVFLDETGFDNRDMLRKSGYFCKGERLVHVGEYQRKVRTSLLCFLSINGLVDVFRTPGTFTRHIFANSCREFALNNPNVKQYPGSCSVWIMDGASIHRSPELIQYLRSIGIIPIFLPAYCPFFNPIEIVFGLMKKKMKQSNSENKRINIEEFIATTTSEYREQNMKNLFRKCGFINNNHFDMSIGWESTK